MFIHVLTIYKLILIGERIFIDRSCPMFIKNNLIMVGDGDGDGDGVGVGVLTDHALCYLKIIL